MEEPHGVAGKLRRVHGPREYEDAARSLTRVAESNPGREPRVGFALDVVEPSEFHEFRNARRCGLVDVGA
jgi:hypothetical protein